MSYLEELLPEFRKGAKIRRKDWENSRYLYFENSAVWNEDTEFVSFGGEDLIDNSWELYNKPKIDYDYIIKNKCLCWFWDDINPNIKEIEFLENIFDDEDGKYYASNGTPYENCRPVRRDEVTFYEDRKDE